MTISEQISELNTEVKCCLRPSPIHGIGVFSLRDIKKGERCYCKPNQFRKWYSIPYERLNELRPEIKEIILQRWGSVINKSQFLSPNDDAWLILFTNHSYEPNYLVSTDLALKDISVGEEVVQDYSLMKNAKQIFKFL